VSDHLFIFEGGGSIIDYAGTLSEYASTLIEHENGIILGHATGESAVDEKITNSKKYINKDDKAKRNELRNSIRQVKRDVENLEKSIDKLKIKATNKQKEIEESTNAGWSVLATLTDEMNAINEAIDEQELRWMELAEQLEAEEVDV
jgi:ABC transport system ATP-binding/permease protein